MDPYRSAPDAVPAGASRDPGLVGDVIGQFADRYAFLRELVQNSIDAGTSGVEVRLEYDGELMHISVRDRGEGMTRAIIEDQLLVLFRSTKESDHSKIGKFGIGFISVLAPDPEVVIVQTARDGRRITGHLYRDLTYELFDAGAASQAGTTVTVELRVPPEGVDEIVRASRYALDRWCRHAAVPIELTVPGGEPERIDRPLGFDDALVTVRAADGELTVVVAITGGPPYVGFFNHGLTLFETHEPLCGPVSVKIQDSRLGHTLSRDDVRRDEAFERAIAFVKTVAARELPEAAARAIHTAAHEGDAERHRVLLAACASLPVATWYLPLLDPVQEQHAIDAASLGKRAWTAKRHSTLTEALHGTPIVHAIDPQLVQRITGCQLVDVHGELTLVVPQPSEVLAGLAADLFAALGLAVPVSIAALEGACANVLALAGRDGQGAYVLGRDDAAKSPFSRLRRAPVVLSAGHALVRAARDGDPRLGASHLVRAVLLGYHLLDEERSRKLLDHTFALGVAP
jgi:molecular chaperone HtpG